jgi:hypothetical protein
MLNSCFKPNGRPLESVVNDERIEKIKIKKALLKRRQKGRKMQKDTKRIFILAYIYK